MGYREKKSNDVRSNDRGAIPTGQREFPFIEFQTFRLNRCLIMMSLCTGTTRLVRKISFDEVINGLLPTSSVAESRNLNNLVVGYHHRNGVWTYEIISY